MSTVKRKRVSLDLKTKYDIIRDKEAGLKHSVIKDKYGLKQESHVTNIFKKKDEIVSAYQNKYTRNRKSLKTGSHPQVDKHLVAFISDCNAKKLPVTETLVREEAQDYCAANKIDDLQASHGYFRNFMKREAVCGVLYNRDNTVYGDY